MQFGNFIVSIPYLFRTRCTSQGPSTCLLNLTPAATQRKAVMNSSCQVALISSRMSTTSVDLLRNGLILRFLVRIVFKNSFLCALSTFTCVHLVCLCCVKHFLWVSFRWYSVLQVYVWHEQHRVGLQVHRYRRTQGTFSDRYFALDTLDVLGRLINTLQIKLSSFKLLALSSLKRFWDTEANVGRWRSAQSTATCWHLGVAGGRGMSPDWKPETQSHSLVAPSAAVSVPDVSPGVFVHFSLLLILTPSVG